MRKIILISFAFTLFLNCSKDDKIAEPAENVTLNNKVNNFVWKAMNSWYNWQEEVPNLADSKDDNINDYYTYLNSHSTPSSLFESLKHADDDFSWFIEDYVAQQQQFQGTSKTFGFRPSLVKVGTTDYVVIYIEHVSKGSPADLAGFKRGDIINAINGTVMTVSNYKTVLNGYYQETSEFSFTEKDGTTLKEKKTITQAVVSDNPVHLTKVFDNINGKKVGYLLYNGFRSSYNDELNAAFAELKSAGIQELVLDLRINGGGSVETSAYLASMIHEEAGKDKFAELKFNKKHAQYNEPYYFNNTLNVYGTDGKKTSEETINRLSGINKLYVLTSGSTASASEMIINGLRPFIEVKLIGTKTVGKNEGSITLYDSPTSDYTNVNAANSTHKMAMQPIVFQIYNKLGQNDYGDGFEPNILIEEWKYWDNILPFGDENEIVLKTALDDIRGVSAKSLYEVKSFERIKTNISTNKFEQEMYVDSHYFNK
ncbi:peptidase S41 [Tenacibaculum discolor]|uniref:Peptidase S41 n=1 Tax=Tenacibaculum discolor TaxID=361581 RepID=A0A2G1BY44_9FLAO|nr:S41 family peptidase [Tenacibaculum discolor]MDP2540563.1 S41 family peptidase [Tenacibaculum discolor]PHN98525.1 peptidase S41 [Tenacibaculum discolor]